MGCVPFDVNFRMKTVNKMASVAPNDDPEVKGQPMEVKGDTTRIVFRATDTGYPCGATLPQWPYSKPSEKEVSTHNWGI